VNREQNGQLYNLYASSDKIRAMKSRRTRWVRHVASTDIMRNAYKILVGKPERKTPTEKRPRRRKEDSF
jgi:hypothetical protein